jgi:hypothetical protein
MTLGERRRNVSEAIESAATVLSLAGRTITDEAETMDIVQYLLDKMQGPSKPVVFRVPSYLRNQSLNAYGPYLPNVRMGLELSVAVKMDIPIAPWPIAGGIALFRVETSGVEDSTPIRMALWHYLKDDKLLGRWIIKYFGKVRQDSVWEPACEDMMAVPGLQANDMTPVDDPILDLSVVKFDGYTDYRARWRYEEGTRSKLVWSEDLGPYYSTNRLSSEIPCPDYTLADPLRMKETAILTGTLDSLIDTGIRV